MIRRGEWNFTVGAGEYQVTARETGRRRIYVTTNPELWTAVLLHADQIVTAVTRRTHMHTAYRAKTRRRNRRTK
jgi:hypothetical protein